MIFIDNPVVYKKSYGASCHLVSDQMGEEGRQELVAFATRIGLPPRAIQHPRTEHEHFDVWGVKIQRARDAGATDIDRPSFVDLLRRKREWLIANGRPVRRQPTRRSQAIMNQLPALRSALQALAKAYVIIQAGAAPVSLLMPDDEPRGWYARIDMGSPAICSNGASPEQACRGVITKIRSLFTPLQLHPIASQLAALEQLCGSQVNHG